MSEEKKYESLKQEIVEQWSYEELVKLAGETTKNFGRVDRFEVSHPLICWSCGSAELSEVIGNDFAGVLSSDNFSVYNGCQVKALWKYLAHLRRHFKKVLGLPGYCSSKLDLNSYSLSKYQKKNS